MTKISMEISEKIPVHVALESMERGMTQVFKDYLKNVETEKLVNEIQYQLEHASLMATDKKYWTGTLQESIKFLKNTLEDEPGRISMKVGVDLTTPTVQTDKGKRTVRDYAVVVERGLGRMPKAYAYTEQGMLEWQKGLNERISKILSRAIKTKWGYRNIATGRFTKV